MRRLLRATSDFRLVDVDPRSTPGFDGGKSKGHRALLKDMPRLTEMQEKLHADSTVGGRRSLLLVLQAMDTAGKGGIVKHVIGAVDPEGVHLHAFKAPDEEEKRHDFLWRIRKQLPTHGQLGVFDRSQYEDVLIARVRHLAPADEIERRYAAIVGFEQEVAASGTAIVKVMLHISPEEQKARLAARLDDPTKQWKFNPTDLDERQYWPEYMEAYETAIRRTDTATAPWYVVPADHKWYARYAVQHLLIDALNRLDPTWPQPDYDLEEQRARLAAS